MRTRLTMACLLLGCWLHLTAQTPTQQVTAIQYYFNSDPGVGMNGNGAVVPVTPTNDLNQGFSFTIPGSLSPGFHNLYVRARDEYDRWSLAERRLFYINQVSGTENITAYQYFFDSDPGVGLAGNGAVVPLAPTADYNATVSISIPASLAAGFHNLYIRTQDVSGEWSLAERRLFYINSATGTENITAYQYYFDTDPGVGVSGNGAVVPVTSTSDYSATVSIAIPGSLAAGFHNLYIRTQDVSGEWSLAERRLFYINSTTGTENIVAYQYYFDTDPGVGAAGNGAVVPLASTSDYAAAVSIPIPGTLAAGFHNLYLRTQDVSGQWSLAERRLFYINAATGTEDIVAYQYYFDADPGVGTTGNGAVVSLSQTSDFNSLETIPIPASLAPGFHNLYIRTQDVSGQWSLTERRLFYMNANNAITDIVALEYYFDADPGVGNGNPYQVTPGDTIDILAAINMPCLTTGQHMLFIRAQNTAGAWSIIEKDTVDVTSGVASSSISPSGPISICQNDSALLSINVIPGATYQWQLDGVDISGADTTFLYASQAGDYTVKVFCGVSFSTSNTVSVNTQPLVTYYADADGDGYGDPAVDSTVCVPPAGYVTDNTDCNDSDAGINPAAAEICNGIDENCNTLIDDGLPFVTYYLDSDGDGYGDPNFDQSTCDGAPAGYVANNTDCNDSDPLINPGAAEACNGIDDNCNAIVDEGVTLTFYADLDGDGYGDPGNSTQSCTQPAGYVTDNTDCDDASASVNPGAAEACNGIDDNCDSQIDEGVTNIYYADADGDGFGDPLNTIQACSPPAGYIADNTDCDDSDPLEFPGQVWYTDADGDSYSDGSVNTSCIRPANGFASSELISVNGDCNDTDPLVNPGQVEICNGIDDDCNGSIDDGVLSTFYADLDGDGYGDPLASQLACTQPAGYVTDQSDCDDNDANEFPGQVWYTDNDGDGYGTGIFNTQCDRPLNGHLSSELTATTGDCDDSDASIHPGAQYLALSGTGNFTTSLIHPLTGSSYTNFTFEVVYFDVNNNLPPVTFPRVLMDYEGNSVYNDPNDRTIIMTPADLNDLTTTDGKKYIASINSLPTGTNWKTKVQIVDGSCVTETPLGNYPDVLVLPDLQIFANDITFSNSNPAVSSPLTVSATIHNVSDYPAQNFVVHLVNQFNPLINYPDQTVVNLAPHSSTVVQWNITTPSVDAWCPMEVTVDHTNVIPETNEGDNVAIRPFINGDFNLPGGITVVQEQAVPSVGYAASGATTLVNGKAVYYGHPVPLADSSVAGATLNLTLVETGATFTGHTNSLGEFQAALPRPLVPGTYNVNGTVTDFTFTGTFSVQFQVVVPPCLPDLVTNVSVSSNNIVEGNSISGTVTVTNVGCTTSGVTTLTDMSQSGGTPVLADFNVPALAPGASHTINFSSLLFSTAGTYTLCGAADAGYVVTEASESNNTDCEVIVVLPALPDIYPVNGPCCSGYICSQSNSIGFTVGNGGGAATGAFQCMIIAALNGTSVDTLYHSIANIAPQALTSFSLPFVFTGTGTWTFEIYCDIPPPTGVVTESNENNNYASYTRTLNACEPNLVVTGCESFDVSPVDPVFPGQVNYTATVLNNGNAIATGPFDVRFVLSGGTFHDVTYSGNLNPGQSAVVTTSAVASVAPATETLTAIADHTNAVAESDEFDNSRTDSLCWDFEPVGLCGGNFWDHNYNLNQSVALRVGLKARFLYDASSVDVNFQVSGPGLPGQVDLGNATVTNVEQTCNCPVQAVLPTGFVFSQVGTYTFTMTADPSNAYTECNEGNNVLVVSVNVTNLPDMRVLSQYIQPSQLNPAPGQPVSIDVTYENIGLSNITDQMEIRILVDEVPVDSIYPVNGLVTNDNLTVSFSQNWSSSVNGSHIIRAIIDSDDQVVENNELNNEATRAIVVGDAANLHFVALTPSNSSPSLNSSILISADISNDGNLDCEADVLFFYVSDQLDTVLIGQRHVVVDNNSSTLTSIPWTVTDNSTTLIGRIVNTTVLEYDYSDNEATAVIGGMSVTLNSTPSCNSGADGTITTSVTGGSGSYTYLWSNGSVGSALTAAAGVYTVTVTDNTGQSVSGQDTIIDDPGVTYYADSDGDGFGDPLTTIITCTGAPTGYTSDNTDCDDTNASIHPGAQEICNGVDDDCDGLIDDADPSVTGQSTWYADADGDGYGDVGSPMLACAQPSGHVSDSTDCDDTASGVNPGMTEVCGNGIDDDCDGLVDENCNPCVNNIIPVVDTVYLSTSDIIPTGTTVTMYAEFTDESNGGPYTINFNWNDGTPATVVTIPGGTASTYTVSATHTYINSAVYEPNARVFDGCNAPSAKVDGKTTIQYLVVYVTGNQFTTAGGWFNTPTGSYVANPAFNGRVNFGNVVKPINGVFKGELELNINEMNFKVHAVNPTTWDYLAITGCCFAQFKGYATINNSGNYRVLVVQTDKHYPCGSFGGNNMIRVKVWDPVTGAIIFDTQPGAADNAFPTTPMMGGSVKVHTQNNCVARPVEPEFYLNCYPNPVHSTLNLEISLQSEQKCTVLMRDLTGRSVTLIQQDLKKGINQFAIPVEEYSRGVYTIELLTRSGVTTKRIVLN